MKTIVLTLFIIPLVLSIAINDNATSGENPNKVVLELFTSQGCSSCPPADKLLKLVRSDNVIVLSYHIDYWNYIGWKDPFSKASFTQKQHKYAEKFFSSSIYTPQVVVNGREHFVGSDASKLKDKIATYSKGTSKASISISNSTINDGFVNFSYAFDGDVLNTTSMRVVLLIDERITSVKRGENKNKTLTNNNIVIAEQQFKLKKKSGKGAIKIPQIVKESDNLSLALIIANKNLDVITVIQESL